MLRRISAKRMTGTKTGGMGWERSFSVASMPAFNAFVVSLNSMRRCTKSIDGPCCDDFLLQSFTSFPAEWCGSIACFTCPAIRISGESGCLDLTVSASSGEVGHQICPDRSTAGRSCGRGAARRRRSRHPIDRLPGRCAIRVCHECSTVVPVDGHVVPVWHLTDNAAGSIANCRCARRTARVLPPARADMPLHSDHRNSLSPPDRASRTRRRRLRRGPSSFP